MFTLIGALVGTGVELLTPWSSIIMQQINTTLADPSISSNLLLSSMISVLGIFAAYLLLPAFGAAGGFFVDNSG